MCVLDRKSLKGNLNVDLLHFSTRTMKLSNGTLMELDEGEEGQRMRALNPKVTSGFTRINVPGNLRPEDKPAQYVFPGSYQLFAQEYLDFQVEHALCLNMSILITC